MKIAIDCRMIGKSGIGTYIENILPFILQCIEHKFLLIGNKTQIDKYTSLKNVTTLITDNQPLTKKELFFFPTKEINKCDVFYSPYINLPIGIKIPIYSTIHDVIFLDVPGLTSRFGSWLRGFYYKIVAKKSKKIFTVSEFSKSRIQHHFNVKNEDIVITYNGISKDLKDYVSENSTINKENYFIFVGNVKKHKGLKTLIEAYKIAKLKSSDIKLVIVGRYDAFRSKDDETISLIDSVKDEIEFTGYVDNSRLFELIAKAKALILPTHYEGFGIPPLEALYLSTDTIITDIPVLKEVYKALPVTFVKDYNAQDLADAMLTVERKNILVTETRRLIDNKYSFEESANTILNTIENDYMTK